MIQPDAFDRIRRHLSGLRWRLGARAALVSAGWIAALCGGLLLVAVIVGGVGWSNPGLRWAVLIGALAGSLAIALRLALRPLLTNRRDEAMARQVEARLDGLHDGLLASVQFAREWGSDRHASPELVGALADQVAAQLDRADLRAISTMAPARRPWLTATALALAWLALAFVAPGVLTRGWTSLHPAPPEAPRSVGPLVGDLALTLHYPAHTHRPSRTILNSSGDFEAPAGTRIVLQATTLQLAREVTLQLGEQHSKLSLTGGRTASGEFTVSVPLRWRFAVQPESGPALVESIDRRIRVEADAAPRVRLLLPAEDLELDDARTLRVAWEASDDFGVSKVNVVVALAADPDHPERVAQPIDPGTRAAGDDEIELSIVDARSGDRLAISVEAYDNNGVDGPQRGVSVTRFVTLHSPEDKHFELSGRLKDTLDLLLTALADRLEVDFRAPAPDLAVAGGPVEKMVAALQRPTDTAVAELRKIVDAMTDDPLTPSEVRQALAGRLGALEQATEAERQLLATRSEAIRAGQGAAVRRVSKDNEAIVDQLEQTIILVEAMVARLALEDLMAMTEDLQAAKDNLRALMDEYRRSPSDALKSRIMRDIQRLRDRIREMRERMAQLRQELPEEFLNLEGLKNDEVSDGLKETQDQLAELEKMLEEGRIDEAMAALEQMSDALDELNQALSKDFDDLHQSTNPEMQKAISELMDQTKDLLRQQQSLAQDTRQAAAARAEAQRQLLEEALKGALDRIKQRAQRLQELAHEAKAQDLPRYATDDLENLRQRVEALNQALERSDLAEALDMARRAQDRLDGLERMSRLAFNPRASGQTRRALQEGQGVDRLVIRDLNELLERVQQQAQAQPGQQPGQGQPGQGQPGQGQPGQQPGQGQGSAPTPGLGERQQELAERGRRLRRRVGQSRERIPNLPEQTVQRAGRAVQGMEEAARRLGRQRPGQARPGQEQAIAELEGILEGLKQSLQPQRAKRRRGQGRGRRNSHDRVRIPGADEYEAPAEFRKELLEAMKDKAPQDYREQVRRYFESLVE